jgi:hypothetical protein
MVPVLQNRALKWKKKLTGVSDQRSYIKTETLWGKNPTEIHNALHEVCRDSVVDCGTVSQWASHFYEGWVSIQDDPRSWRPVTTTDDISVVIISLWQEWSDSKRQSASGVHCNSGIVCLLHQGPEPRLLVALQPLGLLYALFSRSSHCRRQMSPRPTRWREGEL